MYNNNNPVYEFNIVDPSMALSRERVEPQNTPLEPPESLGASAANV